MKQVSSFFNFSNGIYKIIQRKKKECQIIKEGEEVFRNHKIPNKNCVIFIKDKHVGDIVRTLPVISLYRSYFQSERAKRFIVLTTENYARLMEMNPDIDETVVLSKQELSVLSRYSLIKHKWRRFYRDAYSMSGILEAYRIPEEYAKKYYDLSTIPAAIPAAIPKNFGKNTVVAAETFLAEMELNPARLLVLIPNAGSSASLDLQSLGPVIDFYRGSGYRVLLNAFESEQRMPGTEPIDLPADMLLAVIQHGATVLGVQCGMIDICEWMELTKRMIKVYSLKTEKDMYYYRKREGDTNKTIEKKDYGYTIAVSSKQDLKDLNNNIIELSKEIMLRST